MAQQNINVNKVIMMNNLINALDHNFFIFLIAIFFKLFNPKKINPLYGYRTQFSRLNQDTWEAANTYAANLLLLTSFIGTVSSLVIKLIIMPTEEVSIVIGVVITILIFIIVFVKTERNFKKRFYDDGSKK